MGVELVKALVKPAQRSVALLAVWALAVSTPPASLAQPNGDLAIIRAVADRTLDMDLGRWDWDSGVALHGLMRAAAATGDARYVEKVRSVIDPTIASGLPPITHPNHVTPGLAVLDLFEATREPHYLAAAVEIGTAAQEMPREHARLFAHADDEVWVDTLFMSVPFLARLTEATGDPQWIEEAVDQYLGHASLLGGMGVWRHGWRDGTPGAPIGGLWLRGNGWAAAAAADLLQAMPLDHPRRARVAELAEWQLAELAALQHSGGLWTTLVTRPDFYLETSGSALVGYALARQLDQGVLGDEFAPALEHTRAGVAAMVDLEGVVRGVSVGTGPLPDDNAYNGMGVGDIQSWGQGTALMLLAEPSDGFTVAASPSHLLLAPGQAAVASVSVQSRWGVPTPVTFSQPPAPEGLTVEWPSDSLDAVDAVTLTVRVAENGVMGPRDLAINATAAGVSRVALLRIEVVTQTYRAFLPQLAIGSVRPVDVAWPIAAARPDAAADGGRVVEGAFGYVLLGRPGELPRALLQPATRPRLNGASDTVLGQVPGRASAQDIGLWTGTPPHGSWQTTVEPSSQNRYWPAPAPDGHTIAFGQESDCAGLPCTFLHIADLTTGLATKSSLSMPAHEPDWNPAGDEIAFISTGPAHGSDTGPGDLYWYDQGGEAVYRLTRGGAHAGPRWSADGQWIATEEHGDIVVTDRWGAAEFRPWRGDSLLGLDWGANGRSLLFARQDRVAAMHPTTRIWSIPWAAPQPRRPFPPADLADSIWAAQTAYLTAYPPEQALPGYATSPGVPAALGSIDAACHDWPDLDQVFGAGAHPKACQVWVAGHLALHHAIAAGRDQDPASDRAWAAAFLSAGLDGLADFVYGPEVRPAAGYRDTRAGVWQNPQRAVALLIAADLLRREGALPASLDGLAREMASAVARAWNAAWWSVGTAPSHGVELQSGVVPATSINGFDVGARTSQYFRWDADRGNTPAEEVAWLGAGAMVSARILENAVTDAPEILDQGRHFATYAVAYDRPDPLRGGTVRTLNSDHVQGAGGQRRYWLENHFVDTPAVGYVGSVWHSLGIGMLVDGGPWPALSAPEAWPALWGSVEETLRDGNGTFLVDLAPGGRLGWALADHPDWVAACGDAGTGRPFVRLDGPEGPLYLSEGGDVAGTDLLTAGVTVLRLADAVGDDAAYRAWDYRLRATTAELAANPPSPEWMRCKTAVHISTNYGYHWSRILAGFAAPYLAASGYALLPW